MNQEKIGKFILELRKEKNITQQELADRLGVTDRAISNWENGRRMPDYSLLEELCKNLEITVNELLSCKKIEKDKYMENAEKNFIMLKKKVDTTIKFACITQYVCVAILVLFFVMNIIFNSISSIEFNEVVTDETIYIILIINLLLCGLASYLKYEIKK